MSRARAALPQLSSPELEVHDFDVHAARLGDRDRFCDGVQHFVGFVANMGEVARVVAFDDPAERDHLVRSRIGAGRGEQARRQAERAGRERFLQQGGHGIELGAGRRPVCHTHDH
jgi:hypothetical protein